MTITDILISASCGAAVVASIWAGVRFYRDWQADIAFGEQLAKNEREEAAIAGHYIALWHAARDIRGRIDKAEASNKKRSHLRAELKTITAKQIKAEMDLKSRGVDLAGLFDEAM